MSEETENLYWCRMYPCNPDRAERPDVAGSRSFATWESYDRHIREGHFTTPYAPGVPPPFYAPRPTRG